MIWHGATIPHLSIFIFVLPAEHHQLSRPAANENSSGRRRRPAAGARGAASRPLQEEFPELRKRYWGRHLWDRGYFRPTVRAVDEQTIQAYIENQKWEEDDQGFKITAPTEP